MQGSQKQWPCDGDFGVTKFARTPLELVGKKGVFCATEMSFAPHGTRFGYKTQREFIFLPRVPFFEVALKRIKGQLKGTPPS